MPEFTAKQNDNIINALLKLYKGASKTMIREMLKHGYVSIGGEIIKRTDHKLEAGAMIKVEEYKIRPQSSAGFPYKVMYHDEQLIAVYKPAGLVTSGDVPDRASTLHKNLNHFMNEQSGKKLTLYVIHRIDKEVEGIVLFAKDEESQLKIKDNWLNVEKKYYALVNGAPPQDEGIISSWLREGSKQKVYTVNESAGAKYSISRYRVIEKFPKYTWLEVIIETGRKNQIRVHMSDLGCPIVGDWKYGDTSKIKRQIRLVAYYLAFDHPVSGKKIKLESHLPKSFLRPMDRDEKYK